MLPHGWCFHLICSCSTVDFLAHGPIRLLDLGTHLKVCTILMRKSNSGYFFLGVILLLLRALKLQCLD
uniref:Uncharacterized protein n=1 Tax=Rhizophora mucronata TaxID=61149 RepID=A0A2P2MM18_RHIMU